MTAVLQPSATTVAGPPRVEAAVPGSRDRLDGGVRLAVGMAVWAGLLLVTYWWVVDGGVTDLRESATAVTAVGRISGLWSAVLLLFQVILMTRVPAMENAFGRDRLARIHRLVGFTSFDLMMVHVVTIVIGYAGVRWATVPATAWDLVTNYGGVLLGTAGTVCLVMLVVTSAKRARRRLRYESWHLIHLYAYLGVGLALPHQLWTGQEFLRSPAATAFWWGLWIAAAGSILVWRIGLPVGRSLRHRLRVSGVVREAPDVVSVYLTGYRLDLLPVHAGQFLNVRFLSGAGWTRANPFSISAAPDGRMIRITAKALGDGSGRLAELRPGTRVLIEGPYGRLSHRARTRPRLLLIGAGVGITPVRALAEGLAYAPGEAVLMQRCTDAPLFARELDVLATHRGLQVLTLPGRRRHAGSVFGPAAGPDELRFLRSWVPDVADRDVYLCGPTPWADGLTDLLLDAGVPAERIHTETFGW